MLIISVFIYYFSISAPREISFIFYAEYTQKEKKAQRELWRLSEVMPFGCHEALSSRLQIRGKDVSFSSIFSYNNK